MTVEDGRRLYEQQRRTKAEQIQHRRAVEEAAERARTSAVARGRLRFEARTDPAAREALQAVQEREGQDGGESVRTPR